MLLPEGNDKTPLTRLAARLKLITGNIQYYWINML